MVTDFDLTISESELDTRIREAKIELLQGILDEWRDPENMTKACAVVVRHRLVALKGDKGDKGDKGEQVMEVGALYFANSLLPLFEYLGDDLYRWHYYGRYKGSTGPATHNAQRQFENGGFYKVYDSNGCICDEITGEREDDS